MRSFQRLIDSVKYSSDNKNTPAGKGFAMTATFMLMLGMSSSAVMAEQKTLAQPVKESAALPVNPVQTKLVQDYDFSKSLYSLVLPVSISQHLAKDAPLNSKLITQSNQDLLLRLTGRPSYAITPAGQKFIAQDKRWLKSFDWVPMMQEGVAVGEQLRLNFDQSIVNSAFEAEQIKLWPAIVRPSILVMGTYVQNGNLIKLNQSQMESQALAPLLEKSERMGVKLAIPVSVENWVFPVEPEQSVDKIQEWLIASEKDYLLSYKLSTRNVNTNFSSGRQLAEKQQYEISWRVFANSGKEIIKGRTFGDNQALLIKKMMPMVTARLADLTENKLKKKAQLYLNLLQVSDAELLIHARGHLNQELPTIEKLHLSELEGELAQFTVNLKGTYQDFLGWIQQNPNFEIMNESEILRQIDVIYSMPVEMDESQLEALMEAERLEQNSEQNAGAVELDEAPTAPVGETIMQDNRREVAQ